MKMNELLSQANALVSWLEHNEENIVDFTLMFDTDNETYQIMDDGSVFNITADGHKSFDSVKDLIKSKETHTKDAFQNQANFKVLIPIRQLKEKGMRKADIIDMFDDMIVRKVDDDFAYLTYEGSIVEEPETVSAFFARQYGIKPTVVKKI